MRPIHVAELDKSRPALVLTREIVRPYLRDVTVAPITTTIRGLSTEVHVGRSDGLNEESIVSCENIQTIPVRSLGPQIGALLTGQESELASAIQAAFHLDG